MCFVNIYIYNIALQNMDFGVPQKSSKHFMIYIFFPPLKICFVNIYMQYSLTKYGFWSALEVI